MIDIDLAVVQSAPVPIRVAVADRRRLIAEAFAALISTREGFTVTGILSGDSSPAAIAAQQPDVILVGAGSGGRDAIEFVSTLRARLPNAEIVIVADTLDPELVTCVLDEALGGLLLTDAPAREIAACLDQVAHGHAVLPSGWQSALAATRNDPLGSLSERQMEVLRLLADGLSYDEIGTSLFISLNTVKFHVRSIFLRLGVRNRMAAARLLGQGVR